MKKKMTPIRFHSAGRKKRPAPAREKAIYFLKAQLYKGPVIAQVILNRAKLLQISIKTLYRAKKELEVASIKEKESNKGAWLWKLHD